MFNKVLRNFIHAPIRVQLKRSNEENNSKLYNIWSCLSWMYTVQHDGTHGEKKITRKIIIA